jgi:ABC-type uncharacterized transport system substrate-binding protein
MHHKKLILTLLLILSATAVFAHPHTFIDVKINIEADSKGVTGFKIFWVMDSMFSNSIIFDCDRNKNEIFDDEDQEFTKNNYFINLQNYHFFTYIKAGKKFFYPEETSRFKAKNETFTDLINMGVITYKDFEDLNKEMPDGYKYDLDDLSGRVSYTFFIPYRMEFGSKKKVQISCYDETFYCDIRFIKDNEFECLNYTNHYKAVLLDKMGIKIEYSNQNTYGGRANEQYTGLFQPQGIEVSVK